MTNPPCFDIISSYELLKGVTAHQTEMEKAAQCATVRGAGPVYLPVPARALTLTAVNDTLLPLDDGTMPARLGGELYVPYSVFTMLGVSASQEGGVLSLSANGGNAQLLPRRGDMYTTRT